MTSININELIALESKVTPGPWSSDETQSGTLIVFAPLGEGAVKGIFEADWATLDDCAFVAAIRNAAPDLLTEIKTMRAAIAAWVSAKDNETAYHAAHGDGFIGHDEATVLAMERAIDDAEDGLRAIVAEKGQAPG